MAFFPLSRTMISPGVWMTEGSRFKVQGQRSKLRASDILTLNLADLNELRVRHGAPNRDEELNALEPVFMVAGLKGHLFEPRASPWVLVVPKSRVPERAR